MRKLKEAMVGWGEWVREGWEGGWAKKPVEDAADLALRLLVVWALAHVKAASALGRGFAFEAARWKRLRRLQTTLIRIQPVDKPGAKRIPEQWSRGEPIPASAPSADAEPVAEPDEEDLICPDQRPSEPEPGPAEPSADDDGAEADTQTTTTTKEKEPVEPVEQEASFNSFLYWRSEADRAPVAGELAEPGPPVAPMAELRRSESFYQRREAAAAVGGWGLPGPAHSDWEAVGGGWARAWEGAAVARLSQSTPVLPRSSSSTYIDLADYFALHPSPDRSLD